MCVERFELLFFTQLADDSLGGSERVFERGEFLDESRAPFEQLRELVGCQLPR